MAAATKPACSDRSYFCDSEGWVRAGMRRCVDGLHVTEGLPHMRFLCYRQPGGYLVPHIDLSRTDTAGRTSTHTFLLYLDDCAAGGETVRVVAPRRALRCRIVFAVSPRSAVMPSLRHRLQCLVRVRLSGRLTAIPQVLLEQFPRNVKKQVRINAKSGLAACKLGMQGYLPKSTACHVIQVHVRLLALSLNVAVAAPCRRFPRRLATATVRRRRRLRWTPTGTSYATACA